jgi:hypothetical protein
VRLLYADDPDTIIVTGGDDEHKVGGNIDRCAERTARSLGMRTIVHLPELSGMPRLGGGLAHGPEWHVIHLSCGIRLMVCMPSGMAFPPVQ